METKNENKVRFNVLHTISKVYTASKGCQMKNTSLKKVSLQLELLAEYFNVNRQQAFLLANIYGILCNNKSFEFTDLGRHLDCDQILLLRYQDDLDVLDRKGILQKKTERNRMSGAKYLIYIIEDTVNQAIRQNIAIPEIKPIVYEDVFELLDKLYSIGKERDDEYISTEELFEKMHAILCANKHIGFIKKVLNTGMDNTDIYLFLYICWKTITGNESTDVNQAVDSIFDNSFQKARYTQNIFLGENSLIKNKFLELEEGFFFNDSNIKLGAHGLELLRSEKIVLFSKKISRENIIAPGKIGQKELFFGASEDRQLDMIRNLLQEENLVLIREKLVQKSMPSGISVLLYGSPGTGKTESVFQLARITGREIMHVDISQSKSMWFGGSEKKIKQIFTDYNEFVEQSERCPILLFNEADAIFSKRKDSSFSNVSQTENAMQNIILEEMEQLKGIMIATTNLTNNLDSAFERRFLYKVEFFKPDRNVRQKIWQNKIHYLSGKDCCLLAYQFDFSGGQIDNIARKCGMFEILNGNLPDINKIMEFCNAEQISKEYCNSIGFKINQPLRHVLS